MENIIKIEKSDRGRNVYDIDRKIKLEEAKLKFFFWGGFLAVEVLMLLLLNYLDIELEYIFLTGFALAIIFSILFFHSKTMKKGFEQVQRLKREKDSLKELMEEERMAFSGEITLITNQVIKSNFFLEYDKKVFDKETNTSYLKDKIISMKYNK